MSMRRNRDVHRPMRFHEYISADKSDPRIKKYIKNIDQLYNKFLNISRKKSYTIGRFTVHPVTQAKPKKESKIFTAKRKGKKPSTTTRKTGQERIKGKRYSSSERQRRTF